MNIRDISKPVTAKALNESLAKRFGAKIAIDKFTLEQLQDARNKIRTTLSQVETNESFDTVHSSESYQKSKLFLDVLNAAISERSDVQEGKKAKPDFLDVDKDGNKKEPMKKALKDKKKNPFAKKNESVVTEGDGIYHDCAKSFKHPKLGECICIPGSHTLLEDGTVTHYDVKFTRNGKGYIARNVPIADAYDIVSEGHTHASKKTRKKKIKEGAEDAAELVMAAKDMVDRVTGWMEDTAEMQTESMLELADAIRDEMGSEKSEAFVQAVKPALEAMYTAMESSRTSLTQGVGMLTGEEAPAPEMGAEPAGAEEPMPGEDAGMEPTIGQEDEFGAAPAAAGGEEEAGREKRESKQYPKKKIAEQSRKLATLLSKKKK